MALLVPLEYPTSFWRSKQWRLIRQLRRAEYRECSSSDVQLEFWVCPYPSTASLSFEHIWTQMTPLLAKSFLLSM